jgi:hypothetical protein
MRLSVNVVHRGMYIRAGQELPPDLVASMPGHLVAFVVEGAAKAASPPAEEESERPASKATPRRGSGGKFLPTKQTPSP